MPPVPLISTKVQRYAGKLLAAGEPFYARTGDDARILKALKFAKDAPAVPPPPVPVEPPPAPLEAIVAENGADQPTEDPTIDEDVAITEESDSPESEPVLRKKRTYKRRDMTAEE